MSENSWLPALLADLRTRGVTFVLKGNALKVRPWKTLTKDEAATVQANRAALKDLVRAEKSRRPQLRHPSHRQPNRAATATGHRVSGRSTARIRCCTGSPGRSRTTSRGGNGRDDEDVALRKPVLEDRHMDIEQLQRDLQAFAKARENRIVIVHQIVEADGTLAEKIYCGRQPRRPSSDEQPTKEDSHAHPLR